MNVVADVTIGLDSKPVVDVNGAAIPIALTAGQFRFSCPRCGSPYVATFTALDPRSKTFTFTCTAGDCKFSGSVTR